MNLISNSKIEYLLGKWWLIMFLTILSTYVDAQVKMHGSTYLNGYIVTTDNDTLLGVIGLFDEVTNGKEVHFKSSAIDTEPTIYKPESLLMYSVNDELYLSYRDNFCILKSCKNDTGQDVFIKLIREDVLKIYMYAANHQSSHFYTINYIPLMQKKGFEPIPYKSKKHIKQHVSAYFSDYGELNQKLKDYEYKQEDFDQVVEDYTNWSKAN